jgi:hypothetical protein
MSQTLSIQENYLVVFVSPRIYFGIYTAVCPTQKKIKKIHASLSIVRHVGLRVDFSSTNFVLGL